MQDPIKNGEDIPKIVPNQGMGIAIKVFLMILGSGVLSAISIAIYIQLSGILRNAGMGILYYIVFLCVAFFLLAGIFFSIISFVFTKFSSSIKER
jgi:hypothetical protein